MDARCYHHPDRPATGTCCYCERSLCAECLSTNREGRSYCRGEEDCLAYQEAQAPAGSRPFPLLEALCDGSSLEDQAQRLSDCLDELESLEALFEALPGRSGTMEGTTNPTPPALSGKTGERILGFCAARLLVEAEALLDLVSQRLCLLQAVRDEPPPLPRERTEEIARFLETAAGPAVRRLQRRLAPDKDLAPGDLDAELRPLRAGQGDSSTPAGGDHDD